MTCGCSSAGRASGCQSEGHGFDPCRPLHMISRASSTVTLVHPRRRMVPRVAPCRRHYKREVVRAVSTVPVSGSNPTSPTVSTGSSSLRERRLQHSGGSSIGPASTTPRGALPESEPAGRQGWIPASPTVSHAPVAQMDRALAVPEVDRVAGWISPSGLPRNQDTPEVGTLQVPGCSSYAPLAQLVRAPGWTPGYCCSSSLGSPQPGGRGPRKVCGNTYGSNPSGSAASLESQVCSSGLISAKWTRVSRRLIGGVASTSCRSATRQTRLSGRSGDQSLRLGRTRVGFSLTPSAGSPLERCHRLSSPPGCDRPVYGG